MQKKQQDSPPLRLGSSPFQLHYIISAIVYSCKEVLFHLNFLIDS
jgi:hypothetical protein